MRHGGRRRHVDGHFRFAVGGKPVEELFWEHIRMRQDVTLSDRQAGSEKRAMK